MKVPISLLAASSALFLTPVASQENPNTDIFWACGQQGANCEGLPGYNGRGGVSNIVQKNIPNPTNVLSAASITSFVKGGVVSLPDPTGVPDPLTDFNGSIKSGGPSVASGDSNSADQSGSASGADETGLPESASETDTYSESDEAKPSGSHSGSKSAGSSKPTSIGLSSDAQVSAKACAMALALVACGAFLLV